MYAKTYTWCRSLSLLRSLRGARGNQELEVMMLSSALRMRFDSNDTIARVQIHHFLSEVVQSASTSGHAFLLRV